jgi:hypothetical protein
MPEGVRYDGKFGTCPQCLHVNGGGGGPTIVSDVFFFLSSPHIWS